MLKCKNEGCKSQIGYNVTSYATMIFFLSDFDKKWWRHGILAKISTNNSSLLLTSKKQLLNVVQCIESKESILEMIGEQPSKLVGEIANKSDNKENINKGVTELNSIMVE